MKRSLRQGLLSLIGATCLGLSHPAYPDFSKASVNVEARGGLGPVVAQDEASITGGFGTLPALASASTSGTGSFGIVAARANLGSLGVELFAGASGDGFVVAEAGAQFSDELRVSAPGIPFGTPVNLLFDLEPPNPNAVSLCPTCGGGAQASLSVINGAVVRSNVVEWALGLTGSSHYTGPFTFNLARVGDLIQIQGTLSGRLALGEPFGTGEQFIRLLNTVPFFADSLTPGVTLIAQSGHDYHRPAVVPIPETLGLLATGLLGLMIASPKRQKLIT